MQICKEILIYKDGQVSRESFLFDLDIKDFDPKKHFQQDYMWSPDGKEDNMDNRILIWNHARLSLEESEILKSKGLIGSIKP